MRWSALVLMVIIAILVTVAPIVLVFGQTQIDREQVKNLTVSPIAGIERSKCEKSGQGWDCTGLQMIRITLVDGKRIGPYVMVPTTPAITAAAVWESVPLGAQ